MQKTSTQKEVIIIEHNGGRRANQLWNFISVFAYCKERGYKLSNYCFFDYYKDFRMPVPNWIIGMLSFSTIRKTKLYSLFRPYRRYINFIKHHHSEYFVADNNLTPFYLPPTPFGNPDEQKRIEHFEKSNERKLYLSGWMFRNPLGIQKYREEIISYFGPNKDIEKSVSDFVIGIRKETPHVVGVHIRQGDYKTFMGGSQFFEQKEVRNILDQYLTFKSLSATEVTFILCSDGPINEPIFSGLTIKKGLGQDTADLFTLAQTDTIIGSNSTYGAFASYYGNVPFIVFERPMVDWEYYRGRTTFFENKKSTLVFY